MEYRFGNFVLDSLARRLWRGDSEVLLTPKALEVLLYLVDHAGEVVERDALLEAVWRNTFVDDHALSVQVAEVRKALDDRTGTPQYIETRHRRGYRFVAEVTRQQASSPMRMQSPEMSGQAAELPMPETRYARSGEVDIAYQVLGDGPVDLVFVMGWVSHLEYFWKEPSFARFLRRLASFSRLILFDKRGTGLSDRVPITLLPEPRIANGRRPRGDGCSGQPAGGDLRGERGRAAGGAVCGNVSRKDAGLGDDWHLRQADSR